MTSRHALMILAALVVAACARPSWTDPETSKGSRELAPFPARPGVATGDGPGPPMASWVVPLLGKSASEVFPAMGLCIGNTDGLHKRFLGGAGASVVVGWAWDSAAKAPVGRVILTDEANRIVGGGETGYDRPDVTKAMPNITSAKTGWAAVTIRTSGRVGAYGVVQGRRALCPLASAEL